MLIDVIIPAYNAHKTLPRTLSSIAMQTIVDDLNVIVIDDHSDTDYSQIETIFKPLIPHLSFIRLEENSGPGAARRIGMEKCNSEFITFIDADDTYAYSHALYELHKAFIDHPSLDIIAGSFMEEQHLPGQAVNFVEHVEDMTWVFGKIYRRSFLNRYDIKFNDSRANEDSGFNALCKLCINPQSLGFMHKVVYYWHYTSTAITKNNDYTLNGLEGFINNHIWAVNKAIDKNIDIKLIKEHVITTMCFLYIYYITFTAENNREVSDLNRYLSWCRLFYNECYRNHSGDVDKYTLTALFVNAKRAMKHVENIIPSITLYDFIELIKTQN